jgi:hypothetical protein
VYQGPKWKAYSKRRQRDEEEKRVRTARLTAGRPATRLRGKQWSDPKRQHWITAPEVFCLFEAPEPILKMVDEIKSAARRRRTPYVDLRKVRQITPETLALLVSVVKDNRLRANVNGNLPIDPAARRMVAGSGFLNHVSDSVHPESRNLGYIQREGSNVRVTPKDAKRMIHFANERLGRGPSVPSTGAYRVLIECMSNTHQHAAARNPRNRERWWLMVYAPPGTDRASFTFVDNGIGIAESLDRRDLLHTIKSALGISTEGELIRQLLAGGIGSRTGLKYRGKGLPAMRFQHERGGIRALKILSNSALADLRSSTYRHLSNGFSGTVISFELARPEQAAQ